MSDIPETVYMQARDLFNRYCIEGEGLMFEGGKEKVKRGELDHMPMLQIAARAIMETQERCAAYVEGISHEGLHHSMWATKFRGVAAGIRRGDT